MPSKPSGTRGLVQNALARVAHRTSPILMSVGSVLAATEGNISTPEDHMATTKLNNRAILEMLNAGMITHEKAMEMMGMMPGMSGPPGGMPWMGTGAPMGGGMPPMLGPGSPFPPSSSPSPLPATMTTPVMDGLTITKSPVTYKDATRYTVSWQKHGGLVGLSCAFMIDNFVLASGTMHGD